MKRHNYKKLKSKAEANKVVEELGSQIKVFNFNEAYETPNIKYNKAAGFIEWGAKNIYPEYLIDLFNSKGSATFTSIVKKKVGFIAGNGFKNIEDPTLSKFVKDTGLSTEMKKAALDYELFDGFALEVIWNNGGDTITSIKHIPFHKLRIGYKNEKVSHDHLWFSNDWSQYKKPEYTPEYMKAFDPNNVGGKQVFYYSEYNPKSDGLYPIPNYENIINWIEMDYEISKFHLNQVKQGYAPSFMLNFATGIPLEEEQTAFFREFKRNYSGTDNGGKVIITYSEGNDEAPTLTKIDLNDSDERFIMLMSAIETNIVRGSQIAPQLLISESGKLGGSEQREELKEEFQDSYVTPRQNNIEEALNNLLSYGGFTEELELQTYRGEKAEENAMLLKKVEAQLELKGSVAGIQSILSIQESLKNQTISKETAQAMLEILFGFEAEEAIALLGNINEENN